MKGALRAVVVGVLVFAVTSAAGLALVWIMAGTALAGALAFAARPGADSEGGFALGDGGDGGDGGGDGGGGE